MGKIIMIKGADFSNNSFAQDKILIPTPIFYKTDLSAKEGSVSIGTYADSRFYFPLTFTNGKKYKLYIHVTGTKIDPGQTELLFVRAVPNTTTGLGVDIAVITPSQVDNVADYIIESEVTMNLTESYLYILLKWGKKHSAEYPIIKKVYIQELD